MNHCLLAASFDGVRPSAARRFVKEMDDWIVRYITILDFVRKDESDIRSHTSVSDEDFESIKGEFASVGLHFGMTQEEIDAVIDKDYLEAHGGKDSDGKTDAETAASTDETGCTEDAKEEDKTDDCGSGIRVMLTPQRKAPVYLTDDDEFPDEVPYYLREEIKAAWRAKGVEVKPLPEWSESEAHDRNMVQLKDTNILRDSYSDIEWSHVHFILHAYDKQPWYYRLLPMKCRVRRALDAGWLFFSEYAERLTARLVERERREHERRCQEIKERNRASHDRRKQIAEKIINDYYGSKAKKGDGESLDTTMFHDEYTSDEFLELLKSETKPLRPRDKLIQAIESRLEKIEI